MEQNALIEAVGSLLEDVPEIQLALIFGSHAEGRARPDSDLDVAVAADRELDTMDKLKLIERLAGLAGRPVDLIDLQAADGLILHQALTKGRLVMCKDRGLYARLMLRMLVDQEDVMPYHRRILAARRQAWIGA